MYSALALWLFVLVQACAVAESVDTDGMPTPEQPWGPDASSPMNATDSGQPDSGQGITGTDAGQPSKPPIAKTITDSSSESIVVGNSVGCLDINTNSHLENSYMRVLDLSAHGVVGSFEVNRVELGIEVASAGSGTTQPVSVRLYTLTGAMLMANLTEIGRTDLMLPNQQLAVQSVDVQGLAPAGSKLVVELYTPNGLSAGHELLAGSNAAGQISPTYLQSNDCSILEPITTADASIGQPQMHWVVRVSGTDSM